MYISINWHLSIQSVPIITTVWFPPVTKCIWLFVSDLWQADGPLRILQVSPLIVFFMVFKHHFQQYFSYISGSQFYWLGKIRVPGENHRPVVVNPTTIWSWPWQLHLHHLNWLPHMTQIMLSWKCLQCNIIWKNSLKYCDIIIIY